MQLPNQPEAEATVLGKALLDKQAAITLLSKLCADDFFVAQHRQVFRAIELLSGRGDKIDIVSVGDVLRNQPEFGGMAFLTTLVENIISTDNVAENCDVILEDSNRRRFIIAARDSAEKASNADIPFAEVLNDMQGSMLSFGKKQDASTISICDSAKLVAKRAEILATQGGHGIIGIPTGFRRLDDKLQGYQKGKLYVIGGRTSHGKSMVALHSALCAARNGYRVIYVILEMTAEALATRAIASEANVYSLALQTGRLQPKDWSSVASALGKMSAYDLHIDDATRGRKLIQIMNRLRRYHSEKPIDMFIVDHIHLIEGKRSSTENRRSEVSDISHSLLSLTLELNCVGVEVCQLRRPAAAAEALKPPSKYDLMESGSLEQDAHAIIMVFYKGQELPDDQSLRNEIELDVEKNRGSGLMGNIPLYFEGDKCRILDDVPFVPNVAPQDIDKEEKTEETQEQQTIKYG